MKPRIFLDAIQEYAQSLVHNGEEYQLIQTKYTGVACILVKEFISGHVIKCHNVHRSPHYMSFGDWEIDREGDDIIVNGCAL